MGVLKRVKSKFFLLAGCVLIPVIFFCIFWRQPHLVFIPVTFTSSGIPMLDASIEGKTYPLQFDLGSKFPLSLKKNVLDAINDKKSFGMAKWQDVKGNFYEEPSYYIPCVKIGN